MRMAVGVDVQRVALLAQVEPEGGIEFSRLLDVGDGEIEAVERMHAELAGTAVDRLRERTDLRHRTTSFKFPAFGRDHTVRRTAGKATRHCLRSMASRCSCGIATPS